MKTRRRWTALILGAAVLAVSALSGCQTNVAGMTLPSGWYLQHPPQFFMPSPNFPLGRELANQEAINLGAGGAGPNLLPAAIPGNIGGGLAAPLPPN